MRKDARDEATLSGDVRRAIHASDLSLLEIATQAGITPIMLDDFLTGERTLRSDVMDRLANVLGGSRMLESFYEWRSHLGWATLADDATEHILLCTTYCGI